MMLHTSSVEAAYVGGVEWNAVEWSVRDLDFKSMTSF